MGLMRFRVYPPERITPRLVRQAYLSGMDRTSWPVRATVEGDVLALGRSVNDSAALNAPWPVEGFGSLMLNSAVLLEREEPYWLPLELARGTLMQVRNQLAEWRMIGMSVPRAAEGKLASAMERLSWAAVSQDDPPVSAAAAAEALRTGLVAGELLAAAFAEQALAVRRQNGFARSGVMAVDLGTTMPEENIARHVPTAFNAAAVPISWRETETTEGQFFWKENDRQIQWCREQGLKVIAGPLVSLDRRMLPDWLYLFEDDFDNVLDFASGLIRATVERYRGKVDYWVCAGRPGDDDALALSEHDRLRLIAHGVELVRSLDPDVPALVSFDRPWAEYLHDRHADFPPLHFAETLGRADIGLTGLMIELNLGYPAGGTPLRPIIELGRMIDAWSTVGLPLWVSLCAPSAAVEDPLARRGGAAPRDNWTAAAQNSLAARIVPFLLAKPAVQGVLWNQLDDGRPHDFPHGGLLDARGRPKPALRSLAAIRKAILT
jgi:hypothetical protein